MDDDGRYARIALTGRLVGIALWVVLLVGAATLGAAGAPNAIVGAFAVLGVLGFLVIGLRRTR
jgi:hypothetical protein